MRVRLELALYCAAARGLIGLSNSYNNDPTMEEYNARRNYIGFKDDSREYGPSKWPDIVPSYETNPGI